MLDRDPRRRLDRGVGLSNGHRALTMLVSRSSRTQWSWSPAHREGWELRLCNWRRPWATRSSRFRAAMKSDSAFSRLGAAYTFDPADPQWRAGIKNGPGFARGQPRRRQHTGASCCPKSSIAWANREELVWSENSEVRCPIFTRARSSRWLRIGAMALSYYTPEQHRAAWQDLVAIMARSEARPLVEARVPARSASASLRTPSRRADGESSTQLLAATTFAQSTYGLSATDASAV